MIYSYKRIEELVDALSNSNWERVKGNSRYGTGIFRCILNGVHFYYFDNKLYYMSPKGSEKVKTGISIHYTHVNKLNDAVENTISKELDSVLDFEEENRIRELDSVLDSNKN